MIEFGVGLVISCAALFLVCAALSGAVRNGRGGDDE